MTIWITILTLTATLTISSVLGQDYLSMTKDYIKKEYQDLQDCDDSYKISFPDTVDGLAVLVEGYEKIELEYYFDYFNDCDSIVIKYSCGECLDKHIKDFLDTKDRKWKKIDTDVYISTKWMTKTTTKQGTTVGSPKMIIKRTSDQDICATIYFLVPMMDKKSWKELTKK